MSLAVIYTRAKLGVDAPLVTVEIHISRGLPALSIVGLPEAAVRESKDRVRSAIINSRFEFPSQRITINLAPADLPKEGGRFDLAIALGILAATEQIPKTVVENKEFIGELALSGELRPVPGSLSAAMAAGRNSRIIFVPLINAAEAALPKQARVYGAQHLLDICNHLTGREKLLAQAQPKAQKCQWFNLPDMSDVKGQHGARRALEIAAAGNHSILMVGPPGAGKTMLASRLPGILPPLTEIEAMETATVLSLSQQGLDTGQLFKRPFRSPHHTASSVALVGGGSHPKPGEISLAHHGVLFLDELPEFDRKVLEVLREPLESGEVVISRAMQQVTFPARFQLVAAMNPCPCGYLGDPERGCGYTCEKAVRYQQKISGPLMDRIDLHVDVQALAKGVLGNSKQHSSENSEQVRVRVIAARNIQSRRQKYTNSALDQAGINAYCELKEKDREFLDDAMERLKLSARSYHRVVKIARTIADLAGSDHINSEYLTEALGYRMLDRAKN